jgi:hypothetical protein
MLVAKFESSSRRYWCGEHPSNGITVLVFDAINVIANYLDTIGGPAQVVYTITMLMIRLMIIFFAVSALLLRPIPRA